MSYTRTDYKTKKALKEDLAKGIKVEVFNPVLGYKTLNGFVYLEGPHYPKPHTWYARAMVKDNIITELK